MFLYQRVAAISGGGGGGLSKVGYFRKKKMLLNGWTEQATWCTNMQDCR